MTGSSENSSRWRPSAGRIEPGLHMVATPIGAARDITLRALDILAGADVLAAEDTRTLRHLMEIHGISLEGRPLIAVHDHNEKGIATRITGLLSEGKSVAYASEAGTPLISDPGFGLARAAVEAGIKVLAAPGPSALLAALAVAGLPTDRFLFAGFPPTAAGERQRFLSDATRGDATLVIYESPRRIRKTLAELIAICGPERLAAVCRELTKKHEEVVRGSLGEVLAHFGDQDPKGEIVLVVDRGQPDLAGPEAISAALDQALITMRVKEAAAFVAQTLNVPRREVYQMALARSQKPD